MSHDDQCRLAVALACLPKAATQLEDALSTVRAVSKAVETSNLEIDRLRKILAHVPARIAIKAKEDAGFGDEINTDWRGVEECDNDIRDT